MMVKTYSRTERKGVRKGEEDGLDDIWVIEKSCNKLLIGKTFWKVIALPYILMGNQVVNFM